MQETKISEENYYIMQYKHAFKRSPIQKQGGLFSEAHIQRSPSVNFWWLKAESKENSKQQMLLLAQVYHKLCLAPRSGVSITSLNTALEKEYIKEEEPKQQYNSEIDST